MSHTDDLLAHNAAYAASFDHGELQAPPVLHTAIVTCMDARIDVHALLGIAEGDCHVIRNAGGVVTDDAFRAAIESDTGLRPPWAAEAFADLDTEVRQSIARVKTSPFLPHRDAVRGFVYDVQTGHLREVAAPATTPGS